MKRGESQPNSFSESQNFRTGTSASFMQHQSKWSVSPGYTELKWLTSSCSLVSLLSCKEGVIGLVYCHSDWHSPSGQSCPVLACLPLPVVWLGHGLLVQSSIAGWAGWLPSACGSRSHIS